MIAVIIPCYKTRDQVVGVLERMPEYVSEIILVDDGCPQQTGQYAKENFSDARLKVLYHSENKGIGAAMKTGFAEALKGNAEICVKLDSDGQMAPELMLHFVEPIRNGEADCCKGNRFYYVESLQAMPTIRLLGNSFLSFFSKLSCGYWHVMDPTNGYIALHRKVVEHLPLEKLDDRYFFETDLMFRLNILNALVLDVPMDAVYGSEQSNLSVAGSLFPFLWKNIRSFSKRVFYNYFLRDFTIASLQLVFGVILFLSGAIYGLSNYTHYSSLDTTTPTGIQVITAILLLTGFQLLLSFITVDMARTPRRPIHNSLPEID